MARTLHVANRMRLPLERLCHPRAGTGTLGVDLETPVDATRWFVCPTLTPLYYCDAYGLLSPAQALRYNQLMGMLHNEVIAFFETTFAANVLGTLARGDVPRELADCLHNFVREETGHTEVFRKLNRASAPQWYADTNHYILRIPRATARVLDHLTRRPMRFPMVLWVMLIMEERSLEISRRCARMGRDRIEPHYAAVYRAHLHDEVRHVQIDWHLIERFYSGRGRLLREVNAALFRLFVLGFFLTPARSTVRVIDLLVAEFPRLAPLRPRMAAELRGLCDHPAYRMMMYSQDVNPITYALLDHFPELAAMKRAMTRLAGTADAPDAPAVEEDQLGRLTP